MSTIIQIKRTTTANLPTTLEQGELSYIYDTSSTDTDAGGNGGRIYIGDPTSNSNTPIKIGGKYYTDLMEHSHGTLTASAALLVDSNKKINELLVDNITIDGNAITSTNTNGDITVTPNGTGKSVITNIYTDASTSLQEYIEDISGGSVTAGEGIDVAYDDAAGTTTISGEDATVTNKGIASFATADFGVSSGAVSLSDTVVKAISTDSGALTVSGHGVSVLGGEGMDVTHSGTTITVAGEDASTSNKGVASFNSTDFTVTSGAVAVNTTTLGTTGLNPGETVTDVAGLTSLIVDNLKMNGNTLSSTDGSNQLFIDPAPEDSDGGNLIIRGNLTVQGVQTIINSTTMSVNDLNLVLADSAGNAAAADGAGITINGANATILYNAGTNRFDINKSINLPTGSDFLVNGVGFDERVDDRLSGLLQEGEGINLAYADASDTLTISAEIASSSNLGVAKFNTDNFDVTGAGDVTITEVNGGTY